MNIGLFGGVLAAFGIVVIILIAVLLVVVILLINSRRKGRNIATSSCEYLSLCFLSKDPIIYRTRNSYSMHK